MAVYATRVMRTDIVVNTIKKYTSFDATKDMPESLEDACVLWLNKISRTVLKCIDIECDQYAKQVILFKHATRTKC